MSSIDYIIIDDIEAEVEMTDEELESFKKWFQLFEIELSDYQKKLFKQCINTNKKGIL